MRKLAGLAGTIVLAAGVGACSSSGSSASSSTSATAAAAPKSGTETVTGTATGAAVASCAEQLRRHPAAVFLAGVHRPRDHHGQRAGEPARQQRGDGHAYCHDPGRQPHRPAHHDDPGRPGDRDRSERQHVPPHGQWRHRRLYGARVQSTGKFAGAAGSGTYANTVRRRTRACCRETQPAAPATPAAFSLRAPRSRLRHPAR